MFIQETDPNGGAGQEERPEHMSKASVRLRVLVVEDNDTFRRLNMAMLAAAGHLVDGANDGAAGWQALQRKHYDLLVTDNNMPNMTGLELVQRAHELNPKLAVVMATGTPPSLDFAKEYKLKPVILLKPYSLDKLVTAVTGAFAPGQG